jgi:hypothetical protein
MQVTVFEAEVYGILACVYELQMDARPEKYFKTGSESPSGCQTMPPLVQRCQQVLNDISTQHTVGVY